MNDYDMDVVLFAAQQAQLSTVQSQVSTVQTQVSTLWTLMSTVQTKVATVETHIQELRGKYNIRSTRTPWEQITSVRRSDNYVFVHVVKTLRSLLLVNIC